MNRFVFALVLFVACAALAETAWVRRDPPHVEWFGKPSYVDVPDVGRVWAPPAETLVANGWESFEYGGVPGDAVLDYSAPVAVRDMTQDELDARAAEQAAAQAEAEAAASLPLQSATGFAVQDSDGHWIELEPTGDGLPVIGVQISNSPITPEERASMKAERKAARDALKAAAKDKKLNDKGKIALLMKAVFGVEE